MTKAEMFTRYTARDASDAYLIGFIHHDTVYLAKMKELPVSYVRMSQTSSKKGSKKTLRLRLSITEKERLIAAGAEIFGTLDILLSTEWNRGEMLEKLITERAGQVWHKDSKPYWRGGDVTIDGVDYQVKLDGAQLTTDKGVE